MLALVPYHRAAVADQPPSAARPPIRARPRAYVIHIVSRPLLRSWRRAAIFAAILVLSACTAPPVQRPREGAPPIAGGTPVRLENVAPPTLSTSAGLLPSATPTVAPAGPSPVAAASPVGSPGLSPIISSLQPAPGATLPAGDVVIGARISGTSDLVDVTAFVDGESIPVELGAVAVRVKNISFVRTFASGGHEVRIQARDDRGQIGGYRWQFSIGAPRQPATGPTPRPPTATSAVPPRTQIPIPTRRPTIGAALPAATAVPPPGPTATRPGPR
jgi:hypothetical protein